MEHVLEEKEKGELREHSLPRREGHLPSTHAKSLGNGVKEQYLRLAKESRSIMSRLISEVRPKRRAYRWPLNGEVGEKDALGALPLLLRCRHLSRLQFPLAEVWD
jgi:hypothetical protein